MINKLKKYVPKRLDLFLLVTALAGVATILILLAQIFSYPTAVREIVTGECPRDIYLRFPLLYVFFAPFLHAADLLSILSKPQQYAFVCFLNLSWILGRVLLLRGTPKRVGLFVGELGKIALVNTFYLGFLILVAFLPRPAASLVTKDSDLLVFATHSHTNHSWDARGAFTAATNLAWHGRGGFNAVFITDHDVIIGSQEGKEYNEQVHSGPNVVSLSGEEVTLEKSHWILLGNKELIENNLYKGDEGISEFLAKMSKKKDQVVIAVLPWYWWYHMEKLRSFVRMGVDGFEIVNGSPDGLGFPQELRSKVIKICQEENLIMTGGTNSHGWGSTVYAWNVAKMADWRKISPKNLETALVQHLNKERFNAVRIITRIKSEPCGNPFWLVFDPICQLWEASRALPLSHATSILLWIWLPWSMSFWRRRGIIVSP